MKTTKEAVIRAASDLADEKGLNNVSLKSVAEKLNIRTPSLYLSLIHILCVWDIPSRLYRNSRSPEVRRSLSIHNSAL